MAVLSDNTDVVITSPANNDLLIYSNGQWINSAMSGFFGILDGRYSINTHNHDGSYAAIGDSYTKAETYPAASLYTRAELYTKTEVDALIAGVGGGGGGSITGASNIGTGAGIFSAESSGVLQFRSLLSSDPSRLSITTSGDSTLFTLADVAWGDITGTKILDNDEYLYFGNTGRYIRSTGNYLYLVNENAGVSGTVRIYSTNNNVELWGAGSRVFTASSHGFIEDDKYLYFGGLSGGTRMRLVHQPSVPQSYILNDGGDAGNLVIRNSAPTRGIYLQQRNTGDTSTYTGISVISASYGVYINAYGGANEIAFQTQDGGNLFIFNDLKIGHNNCKTYTDVSADLWLTNNNTNRFLYLNAATGGSVRASIAGTTVLDVKATDSTIHGQVIIHAGNIDSYLSGGGEVGNATTLNNQPGSYYLDLANHTGTLASARLPATIDADTTGNAATATTATSTNQLGGIAAANYMRKDMAETLTNALTITNSTNIANTTWANGWLKIGTSTVGWSIDNNEIRNSAAANIGTLDGDLNIATNNGNLNFVATGGNVRIGGQRVFADDYHPNADKWTTARTFTIGNTAKSVDGSANVTWSVSELIGGNVVTRGGTDAIEISKGTTYLEVSVAGAAATSIWPIQVSWSNIASKPGNFMYYNFASFGAFNGYELRPSNSSQTNAIVTTALGIMPPSSTGAYCGRDSMPFQYIYGTSIRGMTDVRIGTGTTNIWTSSGITAVEMTITSDAKYKSGRKVLTNPKEKLKLLTGYEHWYRTDIDRVGAGLLAQDVQKATPSSVRKTEAGLVMDWGGPIATLVENAKETNKEVLELQDKVSRLEALVEKLLNG